jgi:hypothetical protein
MIFIMYFLVLLMISFIIGFISLFPVRLEKKYAIIHNNEIKEIINRRKM